MKNRMRVVAVNVLMALCLLPMIEKAKAVPPEHVQAEVKYLLGYIERSGCDFYRNGSWYDSKKAEAHLREKYNYLAKINMIKSGEDFINRAATESSFSGKPYKIRCGNETMASNVWLQTELTRFRLAK